MSEDVKNSATEVAQKLAETQAGEAKTVEAKATRSEEHDDEADDKTYPEIKKMRGELKTRRLENERLSTELTLLKSEVDKTKTSLGAINAMKQALINAEVKSLIHEYDAIDTDVVKKVLDFSKIDVNDEGVQGLRSQLDDLLANKPFLFKPKKSSGVIDYTTNKAGEKVDAMKLKNGEAEKLWSTLDRL